MTILICIILAIAIIAIINKHAKVNPEKFATLINILNQKVYSEKGVVTMINNNTFKLHDGVSNKDIVFRYEKTTECLFVSWKYVWQEAGFEKRFDTRNCTKEAQITFAKELI